MFVFCSSLGYSQSFSLSGNIYDAQTNKKLSDVNIIANNINTASDSSGFYKFTLSSHKVNLQVSAIGYILYSSSFTINKDTTLNLFLKIKDNQIETVSVNADKMNLHQAESKINLPILQIKKIPSLGGEQDILKAIQLTPGVQTGTEGSTGLNVRGGSSSQNLILMDGIPIYNASHLFGFMSVFNVDAIKNVEIYKGGFPANYGGRLSSIVKIDLKEGDTKKAKADINIGLISAKLFLETPIYKDKTSIVYSGRASYLNLFYKIPNLFTRNDYLSDLGLYETNFKIRHKFSPNSKLVYGFYLGKDYFKFGNIKETPEVSKNINLENIDWGTKIHYLKFEQKLSKKFKVNLLVAKNNYHYNVFSKSEEIDYISSNNNTFTKSELNSLISDYQANLNFSLNLKNNTIDFGSEYFYHNFQPQIMTYTEKDSIENIATNKRTAYYANEFSFYINDKIKINENLLINLGLRYSIYKVKNTIFQLPEPRFSANYTINKTTAFKLAFTRMSQFSYMLSNNTVGMPKDVWVPSTEKTSFQTAFQYSCGINKNLLKYNSSLQFEVFYKNMNNLIDYKDNIYYDINLSTWEDLIETNGIGRAYGSELWLHKEFGRFSGWLAYTLMFSERKFTNINENKWYPYKYERRHDFSVTTNYEINKNIELSSTFILASGYSTTMPVGRMYIDKWSSIFYYEGRNNQRMPTYHRLDVGIRIKKEHKNYQSAWEFSVYNAYNHLNTYYLNIREAYGNPAKDYTVYKRTLFPIIPSVSYSIKF